MFIPLSIILSVFNTPEFYIIVSVIAAAIVAVASLPERKGEVKLHLLAGQLLTSEDQQDSCGPGHGTITFEVHSGNIISVRRSGLTGVSMAGALSLAVRVSGFDIVIEERATPGPHSPAGMADLAVFHLDFLAPEWYHIRYESEQFSEHASLTLHVREGIRVVKSLIH